MCTYVLYNYGRYSADSVNRARMNVSFMSKSPLTEIKKSNFIGFSFFNVATDKCFNAFTCI